MAPSAEGKRAISQLYGNPEHYQALMESLDHFQPVIPSYVTDTIMHQCGVTTLPGDEKTRNLIALIGQRLVSVIVAGALEAGLRQDVLQESNDPGNTSAPANFDDLIKEGMRGLIELNPTTLGTVAAQLGVDMGEGATPAVFTAKTKK